MLHEQYPKKEIAKILGVNIDTVTDWIKIYNKEGLAGLLRANASKKASGYPLMLTMDVNIKIL